MESRSTLNTDEENLRRRLRNSWATRTTLKELLLEKSTNVKIALIILNSSVKPSAQKTSA
jgi:hypothetical protein